MKENINTALRRTGLFPAARGAVRFWVKVRDGVYLYRLWILLRLPGLLGVSRQEMAGWLSELLDSGLFEKLNDRLAWARETPGFSPGTSSFVNLTALYLVCRAMRPQTVIETGVANGASSWFILSALRANGSGTLYSIDLPFWKETPEYRKLDTVNLPAKEEIGWLVPADLRANWKLILGTSQEKLPALTKEVPPADIFYHDSEHTYENMMWEFRFMWPLLKAGGLLASDDVTWNLAYGDFIREIGAERRSLRWMGFGLARKEANAGNAA